MGPSSYDFSQQSTSRSDELRSRQFVKLIVLHFEEVRIGSVQGCLTGQAWRFGRPFRTRTDRHTCPFVLFRRTFACKKIFTNFFFNLLGGYSVTYVKLTCRSKIHGGQEKMEGVRIWVSAAANACMRAHPFEVVRRREQVARRRMGSCANENGSRADTTWSRANGSRKLENFGRSYLPQNLSKSGV